MHINIQHFHSEVSHSFRLRVEERLGVYAGEGLSEKQNRALLARPTPVIYLRNHTLFFFFLFPFSGLSAPAEGPAVASHCFRCGELPLGSKVLRWKAPRN